MNDKFAYLVGLMCARGHIYKKDKRIIIEFAHKNATIEGIAYCPRCGNMATLKKTNNPEGNLFCKSCSSIVDKSVKRVYEQKKSTIQSIEQKIIPFLSSHFNVRFEVTGNDHMTLLLLDFKENPNVFDEIADLFLDNTGFDSFIIPEEIYRTDMSNKIQFMNGFLDTAGFFNSGGWLNRDGKNGSGRMRAYLQIVRNWKMPVLICNFLKNEMSLSVHTIDWGHPNIRDSNMTDYYNSTQLSWSREHQVKFFPEYYDIFELKIKHKQDMFDELRNHNNKMIFDNNEDCIPPKPITKSTLKAYHFGENDARISEEVRKHCDSYWQVCHNLGCTISNYAITKSKYPDIMYLTGKDEYYDIIKKNIEYIEYRNELTKKIINKYNKSKIIESIQKVQPYRENPEQMLYAPISIWLEKYLQNINFKNVKVHDTSSKYLNNFIMQNNLYNDFSFCEEYKIKPDIVGFLHNDKKLVFVEVKIGELTLKDIGQLLGYSLVADPEIAILVSPKKPSINLIKILMSKPSILNYAPNKKIMIGTWTQNSCEMLVF